MEDQKKSILLVDDERSILSSLRRLLRREGWNLLTADSGEQGLSVLADQTVDLVISDMRMPQMDGATFLKKVKDLYPNTIRIILTGYAERGAVTKAFTDADIHQMIHKPWDDEELKEILRNALSQTAGQDEESPGLHRIINEVGALPVLPSIYTLMLQKFAQKCVVDHAAFCNASRKWIRSFLTVGLALSVRVHSP
jgi:response regulator RpfG family c-di-GMP phosphodiesterase